MKKILAALCIFMGLLVVSPAFAVCTALNRITETEICMSQSTVSRCIPFTDLATGNRTSWARQLTGSFQTIMERRELLTSMVIDEEARFNPPHREDFYLGDVDGVHHHNALLDTYLVSRCDIVTVTWTDGRFVVSVRNARSNVTPEGEIIP